jgi:predicted nucleic acid-binding protein
VDRGLILETTFLIDLEREALRSSPASAHTFLERNADAPLHVSIITAGELAAGPRLSGRGKWERLLGRFEVLPLDRDAAWRFGQTFRYLRENGLLIGTNDLWIAATGLALEMPVVTRNEAHFRRVPDLEVLGYG